MNSSNTANTVNTNIIDISMPGVSKQKIRINGDDNLILLINTSDFNILNRLRETVPKLEECEKEMAKLNELARNGEDDRADEFANQIKAIDEKMKEYIDYIFDSNVSEVCAGNASMCDIIDGGFLRYEVIISALTKLYGDTIDKQAKAMQNRVKKHTAKYTSKKK